MRVWMSFLIWARSGQPSVVSATVTVTWPVSSMAMPGTMPKSTIVAAQFGIDHAAEQGFEILDGWALRLFHGAILPVGTV